MPGAHPDYVMATKVVMEALSPTMEEGRLVKWLKSEGDQVKSGEPLAEVETDKAVMELVARGDGVLRKQLLGEGESKPVGELVAVIAGPDEQIDELLGGVEGGAPAGNGREDRAEEEVGRGGAKPAEQVIASADERAGRSPVPSRPGEDQGEASTPPQQKTGEPRGGAPRPGARRPEAAPSGPAARRPSAGNGGRLRSSPLARRLASERGVDLASVEGSGPGGRIIKRDIEAAGTPGRAPSAAAPPAARAPAAEEFEDVLLSPMRKTIARRLAESIGPVPTFYLTAEFDVERLAEARAAMAELGDEFKVSFNDIILKAIATALTHHPECNAHWMGERIRYFARVHLGVAVALDEGLITPVVFDADLKSLRDLSREVRDLAARARERKLKPDEYTGSTFSVSNLGMFGIDQFTAIINPPEAGILAVGAIEEKPVAERGALIIRKRLRVTMSCDHRVIDGATGARFLQTLRRLIENPLMLVY